MSKAIEVNRLDHNFALLSLVFFIRIAAFLYFRPLNPLMVGSGKISDVLKVFGPFGVEQLNFKLFVQFLN